MKDTTRYWVLAIVLFFAVLIAGVLQGQEGQCYPAEVNWKQDGASVRSFGCVFFRDDVLYIMPHFVEGVAKSVVKVRKADVVDIILYAPARKASKA